ncbi:hypothetical protein SPI_01532 [Niveomyces insectorum RCEF 264]|uniref:Uncharacterized protein n=1 Tax=Niveomyces insectorum RCEF 264 TaxID=1081102 RepID=A0A167Z1D7_9HYPO|nr:hypothetical protein SPI_01532 [Niveomyces insectorum RCEF 264]
MLLRFGWGSLCAAGAVAYVFAKRSINADRQERLNEQRRKRAAANAMEYPNSNSFASASPNNAARSDLAGSPSQEASADPAPTRHAPATESQRVAEKSKYEANVPYKSPKGDRFS